MTFSNST